MTREDYYRERIRAITGRIAVSLEYTGRKLEEAGEYTGINEKFILRQIAREQAVMCRWAIERNHLLALLRGEKQAITQTDIERAREYPVDRLIEFVRGKALCFAHDDRAPSLSHDKKRNRVRCFACDKGWDAIAILQDRDGMGFNEAVRAINERG